MDSIRHAFSKARSSSSASSPSHPSPTQSRDSIAEGTGKSVKSGQRGDSSSSKRDSGMGRSVLSSFGSMNGANHSRHPSGASTRIIDHSMVSNGSLNGMAGFPLFPIFAALIMIVSDRLEAVLARTNAADAANVAHLAQNISEIRGKSHGLHGIHPGMLESEMTPPGSSQSHSPTRQGRSCMSNFVLTEILSIFHLRRRQEQNRQKLILKCE